MFNLSPFLRFIFIVLINLYLVIYKKRAILLDGFCN